MLIYNFQKEFIGIDEHDLKKLGLKDLEQLRLEAADFADLFVKTPGFIHNFIYVHWIDYIASAETFDSSKAIIHVNNKNYRCNLDIKTVYLVDSPEKKAYLIELVNLRVLSSDELENLQKDIDEQPTAQATTEKKALFKGQDLDKKPKTVEKNEAPIEAKEVNAPAIKQKIVKDTIEPPLQKETPKTEEAINIDLDMDDVAPEPEKVTLPPKKIQTTQKKIQKKKEVKIHEDDTLYLYDPKVASDELGLPIDLIEEFLEDFIAQAEEFKDKLYKAIDLDDINTTKSLSHKLKGVAANLRIEDAFEVLTVANTSDDLSVIKSNIDTFYKIMSKLSIGSSTFEEEEPKIDNKEDDADLDYDDTLFIDFDNVVQEPVKSTSIIYDKLSAAKEIGIDNQFFNELFKDFTTDTAVLINAIVDAIKKNNADDWKQNAHTLKGMSDNMRVTSYKDEIDSLLSTDDSKIAQKAVSKISSDLKQISNL